MRKCLHWLISYFAQMEHAWGNEQILDRQDADEISEW